MFAVSTTLLNPSPTTPLRWSVNDLVSLYEQPFTELLFQAQTVHRQHHDVGRVQLSSLLSIKTGACPEDCAYCPQSSRYQTAVEPEPLMPLAEVLAGANSIFYGDMLLTTGNPQFDADKALLSRLGINLQHTAN